MGCIFFNLIQKMKEEKQANERERVNLGHNNSSVLPMIPAPLAGRERTIRTHT